MGTDHSKQAADAIRLLTDRAEEQGAHANDSSGIVREIVLAHGLGFYAWFVVCCELADREAKKDGYKNQYDRAAAKMVARGTTQKE